MPGSAAEACAFAAFSGVLFGMDQGNYNGASQLDSFFQTFCVDGRFGTLEQCRAPSSQKPTRWVNTEMFFAPVLQVGSALSSLWMAPLIARQLGRRACIFWGAVISFWGMICIATSRAIPVFILARMVAGIGVGAVTYATPQYTSELADKNSRGMLTSLFQLSTVSGVVLAQAITLNSSLHWSVPFALPCLPAFLIAAGIFRFPESPRWVLQNRSREEAKKILTQLRGFGKDEEIEAEMSEMENISEVSEYKPAKWIFLEQPDLRWRVCIACFLQFAQQFTGINGFTTLGTQFFKNAGIQNIYLSNFLPSVTSFTGTVLSLGLIDRWGRRPLLLVGMSLMGLSLLLAGLLLEGEQSAAKGTALVVSVCTFTFAFGFSWGPIPWVYGSEVFPFAIKESAMSLTVGTNYASNVAVLLVISKLAAWRTDGLCFVLFANCVAALAITYAMVPETKGRSLEEISQDFKNAAGIGKGVSGAETASDSKQTSGVSSRFANTYGSASGSYQSLGQDDGLDDDGVLTLVDEEEQQSSM